MLENSDFLVKQHWTQNDVKPFLDYLNKFSKGKEKSSWEKRIVNTQYNCIAVPSKVVNEIVVKIKKGNYIEFIDLFLPVRDNFTQINIVGKLISYIKDFDQHKIRLLKYANIIDCWASCDCVSFKVNDKNEDDYLNLIEEMFLSNHNFTKRMSLSILLSNVERFKTKIPLYLDRLKDENDYYVNMMGAWLLAEYVAKQKELAFQYFKNNHTNSFVINKAISKCHDSFRVPKEDEEFLKKFRICKN